MHVAFMLVQLSANAGVHAIIKAANTITHLLEFVFLTCNFEDCAGYIIQVACSADDPALGMRCSRL
jgi:hypothetical protein